MGYTPELLAGTWVGCDDPFIRIYSGTSGGNEMALPKWGYFMKKVYDDKSLGYGKQKDFAEPAQMSKDPIYADQNFKDIVNSGDSSNAADDQGSGGAGDYIVDPSTDKSSQIPVESQFDDGKKDTGSKAKNRIELPSSPAKIPESNKDPKAVMPMPLKVVDDKNKKTAKPDKPKGGKTNDY
jgi:penicillin-binding protein 1A